MVVLAVLALLVAAAVTWPRGPRAGPAAQAADRELEFGEARGSSIADADQVPARGRGMTRAPTSPWPDDSVPRSADSGSHQGHQGRAPAHRRRRWWQPDPARSAGVVVTLAGCALLPGFLGAVIALIAGWATLRWSRQRAPAATRRRDDARASDLPWVLDLLSVCLRAGLPVTGAVEVVGAAARGPLAPDLRAVAVLCRLGAPPAAAWSEYRHDAVLGPLARSISQVTEHGGALAETMERLADDLRSDGGSRAEAAARRVGVLAAAPLGLCFLPAFVCLGVAPLVLGLVPTLPL